MVALGVRRERHRRLGEEGGGRETAVDWWLPEGGCGRPGRSFRQWWERGAGPAYIEKGGERDEEDADIEED